jgi:hypothetical protein
MVGKNEIFKSFADPNNIVDTNETEPNKPTNFNNFPLDIKTKNEKKNSIEVEKVKDLEPKEKLDPEPVEKIPLKSTYKAYLILEKKSQKKKSKSKEKISKNAELYESKYKKRIKLEKFYKSFFKLTRLITFKIHLKNLKNNSNLHLESINERERYNIISDAGIIDPEDISNEKELRLDYRIKIRMNEFMDEFGVDESLDTQKSRFNLQHTQMNLEKLNDSIQRTEMKFLTEEEKSLFSKFRGNIYSGGIHLIGRL